MSVTWCGTGLSERCRYRHRTAGAGEHRGSAGAPRGRRRDAHEVNEFSQNDAPLHCYKRQSDSGILPLPMLAASPSSFEPAGAGGLLLAVLILCIGAGALVGWLAGAAGIGALVGAVFGIAAGTFTVYRRYRGVL
jgi:Flp pilus assembly protein TadB